MRVSEILKKKKEFRNKQDQEDKAWWRRRVNREVQAKREIAQKLIEEIRYKIFPSEDKTEHDQLLSYFGEHVHLNDDKKTGFIKIIEKDDHYENRDGCYKPLLPHSDSFWPGKEECMPTSRVKPVALKRMFEYIEKLGNMECWWGYGYLSSTGYNLKVTVQRQLVMHFELKD